MQILRIHIKVALDCYDTGKSSWRKFFTGGIFRDFGDHNAIRKLRASFLSNPDATHFSFDVIKSYFDQDPYEANSPEADVFKRLVNQNHHLECIERGKLPNSGWLTDEEQIARGFRRPQDYSRAAEPVATRPVADSQGLSGNSYTLMPAPIPAPSAPPALPQTHSELLDFIGYDGAIPEEFACALESSNIMTKAACLLTSPAHVCERRVLEEWLAQPGSSCPWTRHPCTIGDIIDVDEVQVKIEAFMKNVRECYCTEAHGLPRRTF